jgi:hypothetical protein
VRRLDDSTIDRRVDLMKIDVEGAEVMANSRIHSIDGDQFADRYLADAYLYLHCHAN